MNLRVNNVFPTLGESSALVLRLLSEQEAPIMGKALWALGVKRGTSYTVLMRLSKQRLVDRAETNEGPRYAITPKGRRVLEALLVVAALLEEADDVEDP